MVCPEGEETDCVIVDPREDAPQRKFTVKVRSHYSVAELYKHVSLQTDNKDFELVIPIPTDDSDEQEIILHNTKFKKLADVGIHFEKQRNILHIRPMVKDFSNVDVRADTEMPSDDDALDFPTILEAPNSNMPAPPPPPAPPFHAIPVTSSEKEFTPATHRLNRLNGEHSQQPAHSYRGLVNQAMTCYLNSLLQALFMTPEFRNALYSWEFDGKDEGTITYQLQKLFVNLQTSPKPAVETTELTKSFGWDSSEGWHQHDIQELCRVMFDALEKKFKNTEQADLINRLYEGKMIDYVKCLECQTENKREDTFLDIPLPVRPFGGTCAYESVEAALHAFVQHETLDGNNQYHCETCNKKCDAHKGLKFTKFPYILTLHLKRFDFDYKTFHRIKLNDKVTFPKTLNLNHFINAVPGSNEKCSPVAAESTNGNGMMHHMQMETAENFMRTYDECSTTDSGSALEEDSSFHNGTSVSSTTTTPNDHFMPQDDDEGIDMELNGDSKSPTVNNFSAPGPYVYELFAIMIHSGSASGGHYYAYIKDLSTYKWYSFNDQTVSSITEEDIQKSFGGGSSKTYYSGAYSSSANAYMLMYRQSDPTKNTTFIKEEEFPKHIKELVAKIRTSEATRNKMDSQSIQVRAYFEHPKTRVVKSYRMYLLNEMTMSEVLEEAHRALKVEGIVPIERCRLVAYDHDRKVIERSFENMEDKRIDDVMCQLEKSSELLLETREEHENFERYTPGGIMTKIYNVDPISRDVDGPISIRANRDHTVLQFRKIISRKLRLNHKNVIIALDKYKEPIAVLTDNDATLESQKFIQYCKVFVTVNKPEDPDFVEKFTQFASRLDHVISLYFVLPPMDPDTLKLLIPQYVKKPQSQAPAATNGIKTDQHIAGTDSNSEDSSLSDNDRTLVEDETHTQVNGHANGVHLTNGFSTNGYNHGYEGDDVDEEEMCLAECKNSDFYFKVTPVECDDHIADNDSRGKEDSIKILIDKRANHRYLKHRLQLYLNIPMKYFKLFKNPGASLQEITMLQEELNAYGDDERLSIGLGRVLSKGEHKINFYYFNVNDMTDDCDKLPFLCDWVVHNNQLVGQVKRDILEHLATNGSKYNTLRPEKCRLRKKGYKTISDVYSDDKKIEDLQMSSSCNDMILQEADDLASITPTHSDDIVLFIRRWYPSKIELGPVKEILFPHKSELRNLLSKLSDIPEENIEYVKFQARESVTRLQIHNILQWTSEPAHPEDYEISFRDGNMVYYRDKNEPLMELTAEQRSALSKKDVRSTSTYSPRKEHALKICVDASPKKADD